MSIQSPPYDSLRKYNGFSWDFEGLVQELYRVTKNGGVCIWVVGDSTVDGSETGTSFRQALYFKQIGFRIHDTMIFAKSTIIPLTHNRYEQEFEYMFVFSKGKPNIFNPLTEISKCAGNKKTYQSSSFRLGEKCSRVRDRPEIRFVKNFKRRGNIWYYNSTTKDKFTKLHPATFPEQLVHDHIISWSNENDLVLDIFSGSGTSCKMAKLLKRNYLGFELSQEYCNIANMRLNNVT